MEPGKLNERVDLEENFPARNDYGAEVPHWSRYATRWAEVTPLQGRELFQAQQASSDVTYRVRMREWSKVTNKHRLCLSDGRILWITSVLPIGGSEMELLCQEIERG